MELARATEILEKPLNSDAITIAIHHKQQLQFHTSPTVKDCSLAYFPAWQDFVKNILPDDKYLTFCKLISYPLATTKLTRKIYSALNRVYFSKDYVEYYEFKNPEHSKAYSDFCQHRLRQWRKESSRAMKTGIEDFIIIDLDAEQKGTRPEPYFYFLPMERVIDYKYDPDDDNELEYLAFRGMKDGKEVKVVMDDECTWILPVKEYFEPIQVMNTIGKIPARRFWTDDMDAGNILKRSPISDCLGDLDWLLFHLISKRYLDLYASYPIITSYKIEKHYKKGEEEDEAKNNGSAQGAGKGMLGPGTILTVSAPQSKEEVDLNTNPVNIIPAERESLDYNVSESVRLEEDIYNTCVGSDTDRVNKQALNDTQVNGVFESRADVLMWLAENLEKAHKWLFSYMAKLMFGDSFTGAVVSYGKDFYLIRENDVLAELKEADDTGVPPYLIGDILGQYVDTRYKENAPAKMRMRILADLMPYSGISLSDLLTMQGAGLTDETQLTIRLNFDSFIRRFELEQTSITDFGSGIEYANKINIIKQKLISYASEQKPKVPDQG